MTVGLIVWALVAAVGLVALFVPLLAWEAGRREPKCARCGRPMRPLYVAQTECHDCQRWRALGRHHEL